MSINLGVFDTKAAASKGARCVLVHPDTRKPLLDEHGKEAALILGGKDSEQYQKTSRAWQAHRLEAAARARRLKTVKGEQLQAEIEEHALDLLVAVTFGWENISLNAPEELPFSPENARRLYSEGPLFVREQAEEFIDERGNFLLPSKTS